jgi:hypothetical protein
MLTAGDTLILLPNRQEVKVLQVLIDSRAVEAALAGTLFTCFTGLAGTQFTCFIGTKVQILTPKSRRHSAPRGIVGKAVCLLYWYKSTNTDT